MTQIGLSKRHQAKKSNPSSPKANRISDSTSSATLTAPVTPSRTRYAGVATTSQDNTPAKVSQHQVSSPDSPHGRQHDLRSGPARGTRSGHSDTVHAFEWEAVHLEKQKGSPTTPSPEAVRRVKSTVRVRSISRGKDTDRSKRILTLRMSRNRPRAPPTLRDNGLAATEETEIWTKIVGDLKLAQEKNDQQKALAEQIRTLNEKISKEGASKYRLPVWYSMRLFIIS